MGISSDKLKCREDSIINDAEICKLFIENIMECLWLFDLKNMCFKYISPSIINLRGLTVEESLKEKIEDSFTMESLEKMSAIMSKENISSFLNESRDISGIYHIDEFQQYCKDGTIKNIEITIRFMFNKETKYVDILGISRDVDPRKICYSDFKKEINEKNKIIKELTESKKRFSRLTDKLLKKNEILKKIAITDELTGAHNRYYFNKKLKKIIDCETNEFLTLIIFDLDNFKQVNDSLGHDIGDKVLRETAHKSIEIIEKEDIFVRWGGDEFIILTFQRDLNSAKMLAQELSSAIKDIVYPKVGEITASFGLAEKQKSESFECWFKRADIALYKAKNKGRNCVEVN